MIDFITVVEPNSWFNPEPKRMLVAWREGITAGDLFPSRDLSEMVFRRKGKLISASERLGGGDTVVAISSPGTGLELAVVGEYILTAIIAAAISYGISLLFAPPKRPAAVGDESKPSESFTFGGTRTIYSGSGVPLPLVYGHRAVGGIVVSRSVLASGSPQPQQILNLTVALCTGRVTSISNFSDDEDGITGARLPNDILLNENPLSSYEGLDMSIRMGSANQTPIPGAPLSSIESAIGLPIINAHVDDNVAAIDDWSEAVVHIMPEDGDGFLLTVGFPEGLYSNGGSGIGPATVDLEVRYRRVDSNGVPFGNFWPGGPGDPEAGRAFSVQRSILSPFGEGFFFDLTDPELAATQVSEALRLDTLNLLVTDPVDPTERYRAGAWLDSDGDATYTNEGQAVSTYSIEFWAQLVGSDNSGSGVGTTNGVKDSGIIFINDLYPNLNAITDIANPDAGAGSTAFKGLCVYSTLTTFSTRVLGFYWGDGQPGGFGNSWERCETVLTVGVVSETDFNDPPPLIESGEKFHVICTFQKDYDGAGNNRARIYLNGVLQTTTISDVDFVWPSNADLYESPAGTQRGPVTIGRPNGSQVDALDTPPLDPTSGQTYRVDLFTNRMFIDRVVFYEQVLNESEVFFKYSGGLGLIPKLQGESVESWWEMDGIDHLDTGSGVVSLIDRSGNGHNLRAYIQERRTIGLGVPSYLISGIVPLSFPPLMAPALDPSNYFDVEPGIPASVPLSGAPLRGRFEVSIQRTNLVADNDNISDKAQLDSITIYNSTAFSFPGVALLSLRLPAQDQLTNLSPNLSIPVRGPAVAVWDGLSETSPTYNYQYTQNNAWISLDILTSTHTGMDRFHDLTRSPLIPKMKSWADFCGELVSDQTPDVYGDATPGSMDTLTYTPLFPEGVVMTLSLGLTADGGRIPIPAGWKTAVDSGFPPAKVVEISGIPNADVLNGWPADGMQMEITHYSDNNNVSFIRLAWPEGMAAPSSPPLGPNGTTQLTMDFSLLKIVSLEARSEADVVLDQENNSAWDSMLEVASGGRAIPIRLGDRVGASFQNIRTPVQMFSSANIIPGSLTLSSIASDEEFNSIHYQFHNRDKQWRRESVSTDHAILSDGSETQRSTKNFSSSVITRPSQIARESRYQLNFNRLVRQWIEFDTFTEALALEPGDVFLFSGSLPAYGYAGRMPGGLLPTSTAIIVDVDVTLSDGETYQFATITQSGLVVERAISSAAGFYAAGSTITSSVPVASGESVLPDAHWAIGSLSTTTRRFQLSSISIATDLSVTLVGAEYLDAVYDETGFPDLPDSSGTELYDPTQGNGFPPALASLSVEEFSGPNPFGSSGAFGVLVSVQHARDSIMLDTLNQAGNSNSVRVSAKLVGSSLEPRMLGYIPAGANQGTFDLGGGVWSPGDTIEISAAAESPTGASLGPLRSRKARITLTGRSVMPNAPSGLTAVQTGSSVIYTLGAPISTERARPVSAEIRVGGWILGQHVATVVPGESTRSTDAWFSLPTSVAGRSAPKFYARYEYANGQYSDIRVLHNFAPTAPGTVLSEDSFEDGPWDSVVGDSGSVALVELENETQGTGEEWLRFTDASTALVGTWTSPEWDAGSEREHAVFFVVEGSQVHPGSYDGSPFTSRTVRDHSVEGPLSDFPDTPDGLSGQVDILLEVAYSLTATPGTNWQVYRPGIYTARSFAFRITLTRPTVEFNVDIWRGAFRITEPASRVTYSGSFN